MKGELISWIIPCFNEEEVIETAIKRIISISRGKKEYKWELILIDDGSKDRTREKIKLISEKESGITLIGLSRNFGHQIAVQAGLNNCLGSAAIIIDADLQDPPEVALDMIQKWEEGFDVIYARRKQRESESIFKKLSALIFYRIIKNLSEVNIPVDTGDFRLIDKKVIKALNEMPENFRFMRGLISWVGFKQSEILYVRHKRYAGVSKYPLQKMITFAMEGITSFSRKPLQIASITGFIFSIASIIGIAYVVFIRLFTESWVSGWAFLACILLLSSGIQMLFIGILGEYIGRTYIETKKRPLYFINERIDYNNTI